MNNKYRYILLNIIIYICGLIIIATLFKIQVIHGLEYRKKSNARLVREEIIEPARGKIYDRSGKKLADSKICYKVNVFRNNLDRERLNKLIKTFVKILEKNSEEFNSIFPINYPYQFTKSSDELKKWKKDNLLPDESTPKECVSRLKNDYGIDEEDEISTYNQVALKYTILNSHNYLKTPIEIASNIKKKTVLEIYEKSNDMPGLSVLPYSVREYPNNNLASHVLGYIGKVTKEDIQRDNTYLPESIIGKTGIEKQFESTLRGKRGKKLIEIDINGNIVSTKDIFKAESGHDVVLTIDSNLQRALQNSLKNYLDGMNSGRIAKKIIRAKAASAVVMNVKSGEVLAMANYPDYSPNDFVGGISQKNWEKYNIPTSPLLNRATEGLYAPGSTFKMVSAIAGLESGKFTIWERINDIGVYPAYHRPECWIYTETGRGHGRLNVVGAIAQSCNYYFYEVGNRLGPNPIVKYAQKFGFGNKTGIEISEEKGEVASEEVAKKYNQKWDMGGTLSLPIGQSYTRATPLQLCKYVATLANNGKIVNPTIVKRILGPDERSKEIEKKDEKIQIKKQNIDAVLRGMRAVIAPGGSASGSFKIIKTKIAGKTGSAEAGAYVNALFVGFSPYINPEIAFAIVIENGKAGHYIAPIVKDIISAYTGENISKISDDPNTFEYLEKIL